jgi:type 1 glutamine amidotransferase
VGARFKRHDPGVSSRGVAILDPETAATRALPNPWVRTDEWYEFRTAPAAHVLAALDQTRPLAWCHRYDGGRSVYTAMGHTKESYAEPRFLAHLLGALEMAAGRARFDCAD